MSIVCKSAFQGFQGMSSEKFSNSRLFLGYRYSCSMGTGTPEL